MSSVEELENSIRAYEAQLTQVGDALKACQNDTEKASLENLRLDLTELLELSRETLREQTGQTSSGNGNDDGADLDDIQCDGEDTNVNSEDQFAKEMALLIAEINKESVGSTSDEGISSGQTSVDPSMEILNKFKGEVKSVIGQKCSAPYTFAWGASEYHNALVCGLVSDVDRVGSVEEIKVTVLFTNPVHRNMVPCPFYLDGECRFDNDKCRFSHGECVRYVDLREYKQPIFSRLNQIKHPVLAKQSDNIWYKGTVVSSNFENKTCQIKLEHNKKEVQCDFHDILPIEEEKPFVASSDSESEDEDEIEKARRITLIEKSLLTPAPNQMLGEWEKYTRGIGSKIMQKCGYIVGTGLGQNGEGIIIPISAQILPPGRSLDHCMELREQANGDKDLFSVEKKLKKLKNKEERNSARAYEQERQKTDLFSFINDQIFANPTTSTGTPPLTEMTKRPKTDFKAHTNKSLNVETLKIGEDIRRMEKEIMKLESSLRRHKTGTPMCQQINKQLNARNTELKSLRQSENCLRKEQGFRKDKSKLTIF